MFGALNYLFSNNVSINDFYNKNPFPSKPFTLKYSFEFFEAVKFNKRNEAEELVRMNRNYLFEFDYFHQTCYHWAAKRGYKELLEFFISKGNHINQFDNNRRTPLWLAARNNQLETVSVLLQHGANPFLDSKDGKKPVDVTTDKNVEKLIRENMEGKSSHLNASNYFKSNVLKKYKENFVSLLMTKGKERSQNVKKDNLKGIANVHNRFNEGS